MVQYSPAIFRSNRNDEYLKKKNGIPQIVREIYFRVVNFGSIFLLILISVNVAVLCACACVCVVVFLLSALYHRILYMGLVVENTHAHACIR